MEDSAYCHIWTSTVRNFSCDQSPFKRRASPQVCFSRETYFRVRTTIVYCYSSDVTELRTYNTEVIFCVETGVKMSNVTSLESSISSPNTPPRKRIHSNRDLKSSVYILKMLHTAAKRYASHNTLTLRVHDHWLGGPAIFLGCSIIKSLASILVPVLHKPRGSVDSASAPSPFLSSLARWYQ